MTATRLVLWLAVVVSAASPASAQPRRGAGSAVERHGSDEPAPPPEQRLETLKIKIRAIRAYRLINRLKLDEQTAGKLFPVLTRYDDEIDKLLARRVDIQRRMQHADSLKDNKAVERLIDEAVANQRGFWDLEDKRVAELRKILTPVQAAKLLVALPVIERNIQNQLRRAVQRPNAPGPDEDDDLQTDEAGQQRPRPPRRREGPLAPRAKQDQAP